MNHLLRKAIAKLEACERIIDEELSQFSDRSVRMILAELVYMERHCESQQPSFRQLQRTQYRVLAFRARKRGDFDTADAFNQHLRAMEDPERTHWAPGGHVAFVRRDAEPKP